MHVQQHRTVELPHGVVHRVGFGDIAVGCQRRLVFLLPLVHGADIVLRHRVRLDFALGHFLPRRNGLCGVAGAAVHDA